MSLSAKYFSYVELNGYIPSQDEWYDSYANAKTDVLIDAENSNDDYELYEIIIRPVARTTRAVTLENI